MVFYIHWSPLHTHFGFIVTRLLQTDQMYQFILPTTLCSRGVYSSESFPSVCVDATFQNSCDRRRNSRRSPEEPLRTVRVQHTLHHRAESLRPYCTSACHPKTAATVDATAADPLNSHCEPCESSIFYTIGLSRCSLTALAPVVGAEIPVSPARPRIAPHFVGILSPAPRTCRAAFAG